MNGAISLVKKFLYHTAMPGKSGELGNLIPGKFCYLEGNFA